MQSLSEFQLCVSMCVCVHVLQQADSNIYFEMQRNQKNQNKFEKA